MDREHVLGSGPDGRPETLPANRRYLCRRYRFNLTGLTVTAWRVTCPECGAEGPVDEVGEREPAPLPSWWVMLRMMCLPTMVLTGLAFAVLGWADGDSDAGMIVAGLLGAAAVVTGLAVPMGVTHDLVRMHVRARRRPAMAMKLAAVGIAVNVLQAPAMGLGGLFVQGLLR